MKNLHLKIKSVKHITFVLCLVILSSSAQNTINSGEGTYYTGVAGGNSGNCSIFVAAGDYLHCALNTIDYDTAAACGGYIKVNGVKGSVTLQVVDRCPECKKGDVDMTQEAFAMIDDVVNGRVPITWEYVENPNTTNVKIRFKEGSSKYWTAIQLYDLKYPIATLEYLGANGDWVAMERQLYNFFVAPNGIASPMQLRAIDINGTALVFNGISITEETIVTSQQFSKAVLSTTTQDALTTRVIYPNPTKSKVTIKGSGPKHWQLLDAQSRVLKTGVSSQVDLSAYQQGLYFLTLLEDKHTYKLVKH
jgi:expansin (peptidoglycan-binding protein)